MIDLNSLADRAYEAIKLRSENGADVSADFVDSMKHAAGEVVEAIEAWLANDSKIRAADELADVIVCCLVAAKSDGLDIESALTRAVERNERRAELKGDKL